MAAQHANRYSMTVVNRAKSFADAGWSPNEIPRLLEREFGVKPHRTTVRLWLDPKLREEYRAQNEHRQRISWQKRHPHKPNTRLSPERAMVRMRELRDRGLSYRSIAVIADYWWGEKTNEEQVRRRLA